jgi:single-strand DNA-binding protein
MAKESEATLCNEVHLRGRVSNQPDERLLPSGDRLVSMRVIVPRPPNRVRPSATVDTFDCVAWTVRAGDALLKLAPDDPVEITGALRRRFWRGDNGAASRVEVEVSRVRRLPRPA